MRSNFKLTKGSIFKGVLIGIGLIVLFFVLTFGIHYAPRFIERWAIKTTYANNETSVENTQFHFKFGVNSQCYVKSELANNLVIENWIGDLICQGSGNSLRMSVRGVGQSNMTNRDYWGTQVTKYGSMDRIYIGTSKDFGFLIFVRNPENDNQAFVISGDPSDKAIVENILKSITEE